MAGSGTAHLRDRHDLVLTVEHLTVEYRTRRGTVSANSDVSIDLALGETLGVVGESGCGKSTFGRAICRLTPVRSGRVLFAGSDLVRLRGEELRRKRSAIQLVFQDPKSSLNPRRPVADIIAEPLDIWKIATGRDRQAKVDELLEAVGLDPSAGDRRPHEFSGGQAQRISIARALAPDPRMLICDEPVSALDMSVQAQILNLLEDLKERYGLTMMFIAHDLAVVKHVSDRVMVMYLGKVCEVAPSETLYRRPAHPYTAALLSSIPVVDPAATQPEMPPLEGDLPSPLNPPSGCRFRTRCPRATEVCATDEPQIADVGAGQYVACHHPLVETTVAVGRP